MQIMALGENPLVLGDEVGATGFVSFRWMGSVGRVGFRSRIPLHHRRDVASSVLPWAVQPWSQIEYPRQHGVPDGGRRVGMLNFDPDAAGDNHSQTPGCCELLEAVEQSIPGTAVRVEGVGVDRDVGDSGIVHGANVTYSKRMIKSVIVYFWQRPKKVHLRSRSLSWRRAKRPILKLPAAAPHSWARACEIVFALLENPPAAPDRLVRAPSAPLYAPVTALLRDEAPIADAHNRAAFPRPTRKACPPTSA